MSTAPTNEAPQIWHHDVCVLKVVSCENKQVFVHAGTEIGSSGKDDGRECHSLSYH